jgi:hypothetical protein
MCQKHWRPDAEAEANDNLPSAEGKEFAPHHVP